MGKVMVYVEQGDPEKAFAKIDEMVALAPESDFSQRVDDIKKSITEHLQARAEFEEEIKAAEEAPSADPLVPEEVETVEEVEKAPMKPEPAVD